jgi:hypothetical protein
MPNDNKGSTFLLLIVIALAIYLLLNREGFTSRSKEDFTAVYPKESFEDVNSQQAVFSQLEAVYNQPEAVYSQPEGVFSQPEAVYSQSGAVYSQPEAVYRQPEAVYSQSGAVYSQPEAVNNQSGAVYSQPGAVYSQSGAVYSQPGAVYSQEADYNQEEDYNQPEPVFSQESNYIQPEGDVNPSIFNFEPNDESLFEFSGSNLNDAFAPPIPSGVSTDSIDFKKQNTETYNAKDFLPHEINDEWFETDFSLAKYQLNDDKLINTERYIIGINTVGESLKNASYDIRGTVPNPKFIVSPWNNSTYEPDFNLKPLC